MRLTWGPDHLPVSLFFCDFNDCPLGKDANTGDKTTLSQAKPTSHVSSPAQVKPFAGKVFYLDLPSNRTAETLERDIKELGGVRQKHIWFLFFFFWKLQITVTFSAHSIPRSPVDLSYHVYLFIFLRLLRSSLVKKLSIWCPTRGRPDMCSASGRTLLSPARNLDRVHRALAQIHTSLAAMGTRSKGRSAKQTQWVHFHCCNIYIY